jgi:hypothetical protein
MTNVSQYRANRRMLAEISVASLYPAYKSETRIDIALLVSALFLQRFTLPFGKTFLALDLVPVAVILLHQFLSGKLLIQYDRLLWFLAVGLAATCSLLLNFKSTMLTSYFLFLVLYFLVTLTRPSTPDRYKSTLQAFQWLIMLLSCIAVAQFVAQFAVNGRQLIMFYGMIPDFLSGAFNAGQAHTVHQMEGSSLLKSNGIFLAEPGNLSQITAIAILIEILEFRRPRYLLVMVLGFLMAYSGSGLMILLLFLPLAGLRHSRAGLAVVLVVMFALGLFATGIVDLSAFISRAGEFEQTRASGFQRYVAPFWLAAEHFDTASLQALLIGSGPGTALDFGFGSHAWWGGMSGWLKELYEYGLIGSFIFVCFLASCLRRSGCPGVVLVGLIFTDLFDVGFLTTWFLTILIVLCTLHAPEARRGRVDRAASTQPILASGGQVDGRQLITEGR